VHAFDNAAKKHQPSEYQNAGKRRRGRVHEGGDAEQNEKDSKDQEPSPFVPEVFDANGKSRRGHFSSFVCGGDLQRFYIAVILCKAREHQIFVRLRPDRTEGPDQEWRKPRPIPANLLADESSSDFH
jgi:hypothetical protein